MKADDMNNKSWAAVAGILLLAGIVASAIFYWQRNQTRERLRESRDQINALEQRNAELNTSLETQKSRLSTVKGLGEQKQAALAAVETQLTELKAQLDEKQAALVTAREHLQQANSELAELKETLTSTEAKMGDLLNRHKVLEAERDRLAIRIDEMARAAEKSRAAMATLEQAVKGGDEKAAALEKEGQSMRAAAAARDRQLADSQATLSALRAAIVGLRNDLASAKASARQLDVRLKGLVTERNALIAQTTALEAEASGLRQQFTETQTQYQEALAGRDDKITALSSALEARGAELETSSRTVTELRAQLQDVIARVPALKDRLEQSLGSYQAVRENLTKAKARETKLEAQQKAMKDTYEALVSGLKQQLDSQEASIEAYREKLKVSFIDKILFGFSQVRISARGKAALGRLAEALSKVPEGKISIVGHADNVPVAPKFKFRFPSNWELSSARAGAVARYLLNQADLDPARIEVVGLSRYHPVADNDTQAGRAKNRRVEIIITPNREGYD
jgi:chemotaxis protein MotB